MKYPSQKILNLYVFNEISQKSYLQKIKSFGRKKKFRAKLQVLYQYFLYLGCECDFFISRKKQKMEAQSAKNKNIQSIYFLKIAVICGFVRFTIKSTICSNIFEHQLRRSTLSRFDSLLRFIYIIYISGNCIHINGFPPNKKTVH